MIYFVYAIIMISFLDTFSQLPIISPFASSLGATPLLIGLAVGMYSFSNMIGNVFAGFWIDRDGAKRVLVIGLIMTGLILFTYVLVSAPWSLIFVRFLHGISGGFLVPAAFTMLANREESEKKGKSMALSGAAVGVAAISGPAFGGIVTSKFGIEWVFITIGCLMIVTAILVSFILPNSKGTMSRRLDNNTRTSIFLLLRRLPLINSYLGAFSLMFAQGVLAFMLPLKVEALQYGTQLSGLLMSAFGIAAILVFVLPTNKLFDRFPHQLIMIVGVLIITIALLLLSGAVEQTNLYIIMAVYGIGFAFVFPSINAIIVEQTGKEDRGKAFGLFYAFFSLGVVAGSVVTGVLAMSANRSFVIAACILIVNSVFMTIIMRQAKHN